MAANPNPNRITDAEWRFWEEVRQIIPGVRLGGIWVPKRCYHGDRAYNQRHHPGAYCIKLAWDLRGPSDKSAAEDLTMSDAEMRRRTRYLRDSALDPNDDRLWAMREFYGTLDSRNVYGLIKDSPSGEWRRSSADDTHLWHHHDSWFREFVEDWAAFEPVLSVYSGETYSQWMARKEEDDMPSADEVAEAVWTYRIPSPISDLDNTARHAVNLAYSRAHDARERMREVLAGQQAVLAAVSGHDVVSAVRAELDRQTGELTEALDRATAERAELAELVRQATSGEVAADEIVRLIGERLSAVDEPASE